MVHHECFVCGMTATGVDTLSMSHAWDEHMSTHEETDFGAFGAWRWTVVPLQ